MQTAEHVINLQQGCDFAGITTMHKNTFWMAVTKNYTQALSYVTIPLKMRVLEMASSLSVATKRNFIPNLRRFLSNERGRHVIPLSNILPSGRAVAAGSRMMHHLIRC